MWSDLAKIDNFPRLSASEKRLKKGESTLGSPIFKVRLVTDTKPRTVGKGSRQRQVASGKDSNYATMIYAIHDMDGKEIRWEHEIITRLDAHLRLSANGGGRGRRKGANRDDDKGEPAEQILTPRTSGEVRDMVDAPFKLKAGETVRFLFALVKNDMVELDGPDEKRVVYRLQKLSVSELQLCEHVRGTIANDERTPWNRITSLATLKNRNIRVLQLDPLGRVQAAE
jgi:CRISPR-associated endonuclease Csn1